MDDQIRNHWLRRTGFGGFFVAVGVIVILSISVFVVWLGAYPDDADPKNIHYVLWKHGLDNDVNLDSALVAMSHDTSAVRRVEGLTKDQLQARFGYLRTLSEVTPYYQACPTRGPFAPPNVSPAEPAAKNEEAFFLRDSPWMVVMKNGKAVELVLCKGY